MKKSRDGLSFSRAARLEREEAALERRSRRRQALTIGGASAVVIGAVFAMVVFSDTADEPPASTVAQSGAPEPLVDVKPPELAALPSGSSGPTVASPGGGEDGAANDGPAASEPELVAATAGLASTAVEPEPSAKADPDAADAEETVAEQTVAALAVETPAAPLAAGRDPFAEARAACRDEVGASPSRLVIAYTAGETEPPEGVAAALSGFAAALPPVCRDFVRVDGHADALEAADPSALEGVSRSRAIGVVRALASRNVLPRPELVAHHGADRPAEDGEANGRNMRVVVSIDVAEPTRAAAN